MPQRLVEHLPVTGDVEQRRPPDHQRGRGHVGDPGQRQHPRGLPAEVERAAGAGVAASPGVRCQRGDPGRRRSDQRVGEMGGQRADPALAWHAVAVAERDEFAGHRLERGVPRRCRAAIARAPDQRRAVPSRGRGDRVGIGRPVVDHHDRARAAQRCQAAFEQVRPVASRDDHGDVGRASRRGRHRVRQPRVGEPARQRAGRRPSRPARSAVPATPPGQRSVSRSIRTGEPPNHSPGSSSAGARIGPDVEPGGQRRCRHSASPPSTGTTAPVIALLPGPARNASTAATSADSISRLAGWWPRMPRRPPGRTAGRSGPASLSGRSRADRVGGHPGAAKLCAERPDQPGDAGLGRAVGGQHRHAAGGRGRGHREEPACPWLRPAQQRRDGGPGQADHPAEVDVEHGALLLGRHLPERDAARDHPGRGDRRVQPAPPPLRLGHRSRQRRVVAHVAAELGDPAQAPAVRSACRTTPSRFAGDAIG